MTGLGDYEKALPYHQEALAERSKNNGETHPDTIRSFCKVALVLDKLGKQKEALPYYQLISELYEGFSDTQDLDAAQKYNDRGVSLLFLKRHEEALESLKSALNLRKKLLGEEHRDTIANYTDIGGVYSRLGRFEKTFKYNQKALKILKKH